MCVKHIVKCTVNTYFFFFFFLFGPHAIVSWPLFYSNGNSVRLCCDFTMFKYACLNTNPSYISDTNYHSWASTIYQVSGVNLHYSPNIIIFLTMGLITSSLQMKHSEAKKFSQSHKGKKSQCLNMTPNHSVFSSSNLLFSWSLSWLCTASFSLSNLNWHLP